MKTPIYRRLTYITFIIIFLVVSPLIILYTMGYRYNFSKGRVQKTGILKITSIPRNANISLNGVTYEKNSTPAKIEYLLPGDYEISLTKDGYHAWKKKLAVYENGTTFAEKVMLWKKSEPQSLSSTSTDNWLISPDKNIIALSKTDNISLININSGLLGEISGGNMEVISTIKDYDRLELIAFSPSGRYVLVNATKGKQIEYFLTDTLNKESKKLNGKNYKSIKWDNNGDNLYALNESGLWQFNLSSLNPKLIIKTAKADDFFVSNKTLYFVGQQLISQQTLTGETAKDLKKLSCTICQIKDIKNNKGFIWDIKTGILEIVDLSNQNKTIELFAKNFDWLNDTSLIVYNDFEIYTLELNKDQAELITRLSTPIKYVIWHPKGRHLIFSTGGEIKIIELDNRELRNIITLTDDDGAFLASDRAGQNIYYNLDKKGIFKLNIQ